MPTFVTVTNPASNEIVVSSSYIEGLGSASRLGPSTKAHTSNTNALQGDIFFKFYRCDDSSGTKTYSALDVSTAIANPTIESQFLTMLFTQYYYDSIIVNDIGGSFPDLAERLNGVVTPSTSLLPALNMPSNTSSYVEFVGMGLSSWIGANYINGGTADRPTQVWGDRVGQVVLSTVDPLDSPNAIYDNSDSGCWQFSDYGCDGIIVYTNLWSDATSAPGLSVWSQMLCVWPILASTLNADYACIFSNLAQTFLRSGLGYFDRSARIGTYYGWAGNYLQSIFNDWGIPVVSPIWSMSDLALATFASDPTLATSSAYNYGALTDQAKSFRYAGPDASYNVGAVTKKALRASLSLLWANECNFGNSAALPETATPKFEDYVLNTLGYGSITSYMNACLGSLPEGYNAHMYKYILENTNDGNVPTSTRSYINNGISWASKLASQPTLRKCFSQLNKADAKYFPPAHNDFYGIVVGTYGEALINRITDGAFVDVYANSSAEIRHIEDWLYTP